MKGNGLTGRMLYWIFPGQYKQCRCYCLFCRWYIPWREEVEGPGQVHGKRNGGKKMARKRMAEPDLKSWDEVDGTLKQIREAELELTKITADMEKCILDVKQSAEKEAAPYRDEIKRLSLQVKEFVTLNKGELNGKSREMAFGTVGFRLSTKVVLPKAVDKVIKQLKKLGMGDCVTVKESVNKDILKTYDEKTILQVGASLKKEDAFWYETKQEDLAEV